jgi:hypothetical protein
VHTRSVFLGARSERARYPFAVAQSGLRRVSDETLAMTKALSWIALVPLHFIQGFAMTKRTFFGCALYVIERFASVCSALRGALRFVQRRG